MQSIKHNGVDIEFDDIYFYIEMHESTLTSKDLMLDTTVRKTTHSVTYPLTELGQYMYDNTTFVKQSWTSESRAYVCKNYVFDIDRDHQGPGCNDDYYTIRRIPIDEWYEKYHKSYTN